MAYTEKEEEFLQESERIRKALLVEFPTYFAEYGGHPSETCMAWGFEIGHGWLPILWATCTSIHAYYWGHAHNKMREPYKEFRKRWDVDTSVPGWLRTLRTRYVEINKRKARDPLPPFRFTQIKEKYGALELHYAPYIEELEVIIDTARAMSRVTCESCGSTYRVRRSSGWVSTKCERCLQEVGTSYKNARDGWNRAIRTTSEREKDKRNQP